MRYLGYLGLLILLPQIVYCQDLGELYAQLYSGNHEAVIQQLEEATQYDSANQKIYVLLAQAYAIDNNESMAESVYEKLHTLNPDNVTYINELSKLLYKKGQLPRSLELVKEGLRLSSKHSSLLALAAKISYEENAYSESYNYYTELIEMNINPGRNYHLRARCEVKMDHLDDAISDFKAALEFNPENSQIIYEYVHCLYSKNRHHEAFNLIQRVGDVFGGSTKYERLKGNVYHKVGEYEKALESYAIAMEKGGMNAYLLKRMGICYSELGHYEKSRDVLEEAVLLDAGDGSIYYYLGRCEMELGNSKQAIHYFTISLKRIQPGYLDELYIKMAQCYENENKPIQAIKTYRKGLEQYDDDPMLTYLLANVYNDYYLDKSVALAHYEKAAKSAIHPEIDKYILHKIRTLKESNYLKE